MNSEVFKQAQSRGWMEGWEYTHSFEMDGIHRNVFKQERKDILELSLNDILFGTDFCEKYFNQDFCNVCNHSSSFYSHKIDMLNMSEPERIAFLEKHLEVNEEPQKPTSITEDSHTLEAEKTQPKEIDPYIYHDIFVDTEVIRDAFNQLITQVNANTKDIIDCKLNRN